ncbi:MAG: hypothetical protein VW405_23175, partial [Rhodospirillaceae bacterium]
ADPWERLQAAVGAHLTALLDGGDYARVVIMALPPEGAPARRQLIALRDAYETLFRRLIDALPLAGAVSKRHVRLMLLGAMNWSQSWYRPGGDDPQAIARSFVHALRHGDPS